MEEGVMSAVTHAGLENVVVAESKRSRVDGENGRLIYAGYRIQDLARHATFEEVVYLLWNTELPSAHELDRFDVELRAVRDVPARLFDVLRQLPPDAHPMAALRTAVSALGTLDADAELAATDATARRRVALRLVAQMPTIIAAIEHIRRGEALVAPRADLSHAGNFLYMLSGREPGPAATRALDAYLVLLADHGFNASTFSARVTAATMADPYSAVTSAVGTLKGPLHGGANERVMAMLGEIPDPESAEGWVMDRIERHERIMGIGHRVYKTLDPRAAILREMSAAQAAEGDRTYHDIATRVADVAVAYFEANRPDLKLYPNVDFYSAAVLHAAGVPTDQFTPLFAMSRVAGWTAHLLEQYADNRLIRPRGLYVGPPERDWLPIESR